MRLLPLSLQIHKWLGLIVGVQVLLWVAGGVVMTVLPIEKVRSEHHDAKPAPAALDLNATPELEQAAAKAGIARAASVQLKSTPRGPAWIVAGVDGKTTTLDAVTLAPFPFANAGEAKALAVRAYKGDGHPVSARYYLKAPAETGKEGPVWRIDFDDAEKTSFYLSPETGELVSKRSGMWRFYDFFWRLHILNFGDGENFNHPTLIALAALSLPMTIAGLILLWIRLARDLKGMQARRRAARA